jgi:cobalt-zinc-cadmium efflux system outer membrane protein
VTHRILRYASPSAVILIVATALHAQVPGADTLRLTVDEAVSRATTVSPELARERVEVERARAERISAGAFFPELPELEYRQATDAPFANEGEGMWELGVAQEIELGGQSMLRSEAADLAIAGSELRVRAAEVALRADVRASFARVAAAEARVRLFDSLAAFAHRLDAAAVRLLAAEEISELERNAIRIERGRTDLELLAATGELDAARAGLASMMRADAGVVVSAVVPPLDTAAMRAQLIAIAGLEARIASGDTLLLRSRPEWQALELERRRADVQRRLAGRTTIPNVRLGLSLESETRPAVTGENITQALETDRLLGFNLGVRIPLPLPGLYDVGAGDVAVAEAGMRIATAEQLLLETRIRAELTRASARLRPAVEALGIYAREIAPLVTRNLELLERGYRAGELSASEVVAQQQQFVRAGESLIEAQLEYAEALADLERALGR